MKRHLLLLASVLTGLMVLPAPAQPGPPPGPTWDGAMAKLFGGNPGFTATMDFHMTRPDGQEMTMSGKMSHLEGRARFEIDLSNMHGGNLPPQAAARMKQMGMSRIISVTRRDLNLVYLFYPDMKAYTQMPIPEASTPLSEYKMEQTKLGQETINGHDCVENKIVVTGPDGSAHESTVWNATDLNKFPVKIQFAAEGGKTMVLLFNEVKLEKPDAALFDPPAGFTKYDSMMNLMMSRLRGAPPP